MKLCKGCFSAVEERKRKKSKPAPAPSIRNAYRLSQKLKETLLPTFGLTPGQHALPFYQKETILLKQFNDAQKLIDSDKKTYEEGVSNLNIYQNNPTGLLAAQNELSRIKRHIGVCFFFFIILQQKITTGLFAFRI